MAVKIADDDDVKKTEKNIFIGRDKEINEIIGDLKDNKSNRVPIFCWWENQVSASPLH
ncbi:MAG TPA: hypothetical protein VFI70_09300 [Nitrososphaeraceae archaeon]|nr:hypothetical protein [Nitrososphaeraceae archaeon]